MAYPLGDPTEVGIGDLVEVHGIQLGDTELNGRRGRIVSMPGSGAARYGVEVEGAEDLVYLAQGNLWRLKVPPPEPPPGYWDPMPGEFMEATMGTPVFKLLLQMLPAPALLALSQSQSGMHAAVVSADHVWEQLTTQAFGGDVPAARRRFPGAAPSVLGLYGELARLRRALGEVEVVQGDLRDAASLGVEAVVCPAVASLSASGPAALAVFEQAGEELDEYVRGMQTTVACGGVAWTPGFGLGVHGLIHAVGPTQNTPEADRKLHAVYAASLAEVVDRGYGSVALGSISTGGNGIRPGVAAQIAAEEIRTAFAKLAQLGPARTLRVVVVALEVAVEQAFRSAIARIRRRPNEDLLTSLHLLVLDSMLPRQRLSFDVSELPVAMHLESERFGMVGVDPRHRGIIPFGVEVRVLSRSSTKLEVVGGRRFIVPGLQCYEEERDGRGRPFLWASVNWGREDEETCPRPEDVAESAELEALVARWLALVRDGRERQPGQMDMVLEHLGPMPAASQVTDRAFWVAALINPLPGLGVAWEIRPAILAANSPAKRVAIARDGLCASIKHLDGSEPMPTR